MTTATRSSRKRSNRRQRRDRLRRAEQESAKRFLSITVGRATIGSIEVVDGCFFAFVPPARRIGSFDTLKDAADAITRRHTAKPAAAS